MTTVIGIVEDDKVWMGADSIATDGNTRYIVKKPKIFKKGDMLIGNTTSFRMGQILQYLVELPEHNDGVSNEEYIIAKCIPAIMQTFDDNGFTRDYDSQKQGGFFLIGYKGELFEVQNDFSVNSWSSGYAVVGHGEEYAVGALEALSNLPAKKRIMRTLDIVSKVSVFTSPPFYLDFVD